MPQPDFPTVQESQAYNGDTVLPARDFLFAAPKPVC